MSVSAPVLTPVSPRELSRGIRKDETAASYSRRLAEDRERELWELSSLMAEPPNDAGLIHRPARGAS